MNIFEYLEGNYSEAGFVPAAPSRAVNFTPGSSEKYQEILARVERGEELFHRDDVNFLSRSENDEIPGLFFRRT